MIAAPPRQPQAGRLYTRAEKRALLAEFERRRQLRDPQYCRELHAKQRGLLDDPCRFKAALCGRRSGKTTVAIRKVAQVMNLHPHSVCGYMAVTKDSAKRLAWAELERLNRENGFGWKFNRVELTVYAPNGSRLYLLGGDTAEDVEKLRGLAFRIFIVDEAASYRAHLRTLISEVIEPALGDYDGELWLIGTPGAILDGPFFEITQDVPESGRCRGAVNPERGYDHSKWSVHHWTVRNNPYFRPDLGGADDWLENVRKANGWEDDDPVYVREYLGRWTKTTSGLVFGNFSRERNVVEKLPRPWEEYSYVIAWDFGYHDAVAASVLASHPHDRPVYVVRSRKFRKMAPSDAADVYREWSDEFRRDHQGPDDDPWEAAVGDIVNVGKGYQAEIEKREGITLELAEKDAKWGLIQYVNAELKAGNLLLLEGECTDLVREWETLPWSDATHRKYDEKKHEDHCSDTALYGFRETTGYEAKDAPWKEPLPGSLAHRVQEEERAEVSAAQAADRQASSDPYWDEEDPFAGEGASW